MTDDELRQLLREVDADAGAPPAASGDLALQVRHAAARDRRRLLAGLSAAAVLVLAAGFWTIRPRGSIEPIDESAGRVTAMDPDVAEMSDTERLFEISRLHREAALCQTVLERTQALLEQQRRVVKLKGTPLPDTVANVRREADKAAYVIVAQADRMCRQRQLCKSAAVKYRRVVKLFPESPWAEVARGRLDELEEKGDA